MISCRAGLRSCRGTLFFKINSIPKVSCNSQTYSYATATVVNSKPPIALHGLDGTYASALYTAAVKSQNLGSTDQAMTNLRSLYHRDPKLSNIMKAPTLSADDKSLVIAELQKKIGESGNVITIKNFLRTLAQYNRLGLLQSVCDKFEELMSAAKGQIEVTVISATPLDNYTLKKIEAAIMKSSFVGHGKKPKIKNKVKSDIIGGLIVQIGGDRTVDLSVSSRISKMNKLLTNTL